MPAPSDLTASLAAAKCFECMTPEQRHAVQVYLLAVLAGGSTDPATLLAEAKCFQCLDANQLRVLQAYLSGQAFDSANGILTIPDSVLGNFVYGDGDVVTSIRFPNLVTVDTFFALDSTLRPNITNIYLPNLETVGLIGVGVCSGLGCSISFMINVKQLSLPKLRQTGSLLDVSNSGYVTIDMPLLQTVNGNFDFSTNAFLTMVNVPNLISITGGGFFGSAFAGGSTPLLTTIHCESLIMPKGILYFDAPLDLYTVELLLARCVANPAFNNPGTDLVSLDTNPSCAAPDKSAGSNYDILVTTRGLTVSTN